MTTAAVFLVTVFGIPSPQPIGGREIFVRHRSPHRSSIISVLLLPHASLSNIGPYFVGKTKLLGPTVQVSAFTRTKDDGGLVLRSPRHQVPSWSWCCKGLAISPGRTQTDEPLLNPPAIENTLVP